MFEVLGKAREEREKGREGEGGGKGFKFPSPMNQSFEDRENREGKFADVHEGTVHTKGNDRAAAEGAEAKRRCLWRKKKIVKGGRPEERGEKRT
jgi:hypothetical protein